MYVTGKSPALRLLPSFATAAFLLAAFFLPGKSLAASFQVDTGGTLTTNLDHYYPLEDVIDVWGSNTLTNNGSVQFNPGLLSNTNAADLGANNTTKSMSSTDPYNGALSISFWVKLNTEITSASAAYMFVATGKPSDNVSYGVWYDWNSGTPRLAFDRQKQNVSNDEGYYNITLGTSTWYHIVMTYDGTNVRGYVNNVLRVGPFSSTGNGSGGSPVCNGPTIGNQLNTTGGSGGWRLGGNAYASAVIDEVGFWTKALTTTEINDLYNGGAGQTLISGPHFSFPHQYQSDATTTIGEGDITTENTVVFGASLDTDASSTVRLQIEVKPAGTAFTDTPTASSAYVSPGANATATVTGLANGGYHWQARAMDYGGTASTWQLFGPNSGSTDFIIDVPTTSIELYSTFLFWDGDLMNYYRLSDANAAKGSVNLTTVGTVNYVTSTPNLGNAADFGVNNAGNALKSTNAYDGPLSMSFWVKLKTEISSGGYMFLNTGKPANNVSYGVWYDWNGGTPRLAFDRQKQNVSNDEAHYNITLGTSTWHHVVMTYDSESVYGYLDGAQVTGASSTGSGAGGAPVANGPTIGYQLNTTGGSGGWRLGGGAYASAIIDDAAFFSRTLTGAEISGLYNGTLPPVQSFYAQIEGTTTLKLYSSSSTSASVLKKLPADWIIHVESSTDISDNPMIGGSAHWFRVSDPTDGVTGWMVASDTVGQYISSYDGGAQADLEASSSYATTGYVATSSRPGVIINAIDHYYNNTDTSSSLYSSDDGSNYLSKFSDRSYPELLIAGIAAQENSTYGNPVFDNEVVSYDYGHGIMQLTAKATSSDILYLETLLDRDPDTALATGSPDHTFDDDTKDAVARFQVKYSISPASGTVGYYTRQQLNSLLPTSSIPSDFTFQELLSETADNPDKTSGPFDHRGEATGLAIPPCGILSGFSGTNYFKNCYANSPDTSHKHYAPDSEYGGQVFKYYTNTPQSIYSNIKDGMRDLEGKFPIHQITTSTDISIDGTTTTFSGIDREILIVTASYNGTDPSYLSAVATDTANISHFFPGQDSSGLSDIINKMYLASDNSVYVKLHSPGDLSVQDNYGHTIGVVNGVIQNTFPIASYDPDTKLAQIFFPQGNLTYKVKGTGSGVYGLDITVTSGTQQIAFHRDESVPTTPGEVHTYTINPNAITHSQAGVTFKIDKKGNGTINSTEMLDATSTAIEVPKLLPTSGIRGNGRFYFPPAPTKITALVFTPSPVRFSAPTSTMNSVTSTINFSTSTMNAETTSSMANFASSTLQLTTSTDINSSTQN